MTLREPQQDRSRATRSRLLAACVDVLAERGWAGTTVAVVAERAGVSRGAAQHHYPTREDLVAAAVAHLAEARMGEVPEDEAAPPGPDRTQRVVAAVVDFYVGPLFRAALQLWAAAAADPSLRALVRPLEGSLAQDAHRAAVRLLGVDEAVPGVREAVRVTLDLARGLGLADLLSDDGPRRSRVVAAYAEMLHERLVSLGAVPAGAAGSPA